MVVGAGDKGKTTLLLNLTRKGKVMRFKEVAMGLSNRPLATVGVELGDWEYGPGKKPKVTFMTWDFGGQVGQRSPYDLGLRDQRSPYDLGTDRLPCVLYSVIGLFLQSFVVFTLLAFSPSLHCVNFPLPAPLPLPLWRCVLGQWA